MGLNIHASYNMWDNVRAVCLECKFMRLVVSMFLVVCCNFGDARDECRARNGKCKTVPRIDLAYFIAKEAAPVWRYRRSIWAIAGTYMCCDVLAVSSLAQ
jgi:hypothetical protein